MKTTPYGLRVVGYSTGERRLVERRAAFAAHAQCDDQAEPDRGPVYSPFNLPHAFAEQVKQERPERVYRCPCGAFGLHWDIGRMPLWRPETIQAWIAEGGRP